jgi:hypothetical protein
MNDNERSKLWYHAHRIEELAKKKEYYHKNKERIRKYMTQWREQNRLKLKEYAKEYRASLRKQVFDHYGRICKCCGETEDAFLTIDHTNGGGCKHRKGLGISSGTYFYAWLIKNNFPEGFQTLCWNCNCAKIWRNVCPHQLKKVNSVATIPEQIL